MAFDSERRGIEGEGIKLRGEVLSEVCYESIRLRGEVIKVCSQGGIRSDSRRFSLEGLTA